MVMSLTVHSREPRSKRRRSQSLNKENVDAPEDLEEHPNDEEEVEGIDLHQQRYPWEGSDMDYLYDEFIHGSQEVKEEEANHPNDEEEVEGIDLHQQRYPWEGSDMDYLYDEVSISLDGLRSIFESRRFFNMQNHNAVGVVSEITKLAICQDSKSISADGKWGCYVGCLVYWAWLYKAQAGNICVAAFDSTCSGICRSADPIVEFIHGSQEVKEEEAKHPNDEEEVEGIDLHQQRYPWEGSDMDYLYDELLSMELTLEIDGAMFHVPNANASSNVDSQL
ncbi:hypothetical protein F2Q69_00010767 [Brassica cretica]|uniref:Uncharacterized protein n=1 Tax=Brassica cretica TaxID=69181 RepID=A0A8S9R902_BRACR|nr:hypothetical protein F2Q69_00010767 [Brassica cretica]